MMFGRIGAAEMSSRQRRMIVGVAAAVLVVAGAAVWLSLPDPNSPVCPNCRAADHTLPVVYGLPTPDLWEEARAGRCRLGGCVVSDDSPRWHCRQCGAEWGRVPVPGPDPWWAFRR